MARGHGTGRRAALLVPVVVAVLVALTAGRSSAGPGPSRAGARQAASEAAAGAALWRQDCATCHRADGSGSERGPDIREAGAGGVDFEVATGRMPLEDADDRPTRSPTPYDQEQIDQLVAYARATLDGPDVPEVDLAAADAAEGGELFRLSCAACHQSAGEGGALAYGQYAPDLSRSTPTQVVEAMRLGPQQMPVYDRASLDDGQAADIAAYVEEIEPPQDRGGWGIWHYGPVPEGFIALTLGIGTILLGARWLGSSRGS